MKTIDVLLAAFLASLLVLINVIISYQMGGWAASYASFYSFKNIPDMTGKNVFVTGINSGIGKITAIELARKGATVYGTVRSLEKADFVQEVNRGLKGKVVPLQLDLADLASVEAAAKQLLRMNLKSLDVLINNAAVMMTPPSLSAEGVEAQFATNYLGHYLLTRLLLPKLKASKGRIVHVSSLAHHLSYKAGISFPRLESLDGYSPVLAYGQSKLANILFSAELDKRLNGSGVTSNSLHPGGITSGLQRYIVDAYSGTEESLFRTVLSRVHALSSAIASLCVLMTPEDGALTQLYVASAPELAGVSGKYFVPVTRTSTPSHHVLNETLREKLWDWSEKKVAKYLPKK